MIDKTIEGLGKPPSEREAADGLATYSFRTLFFSHLTTAGREETLKSPAQRVTLGGTYGNLSYGILQVVYEGIHQEHING